LSWGKLYFEAIITQGLIQMSKHLLLETRENQFILVVSVRMNVSMEPPQYDGGLLGFQKREYLAKRKTREGLRKCLYLIFKQSGFGFKEVPSRAASEPS